MYFTIYKTTKIKHQKIKRIFYIIKIYQNSTYITIFKKI